MYKQSIQNNALPHFNKNKYLFKLFYTNYFSLYTIFSIDFFTYSKLFPQRKSNRQMRSLFEINAFIYTKRCAKLVICS